MSIYFVHSSSSAYRVQGLISLLDYYFIFWFSHFGAHIPNNISHFVWVSFFNNIIDAQLELVRLRSLR